MGGRPDILRVINRQASIHEARRVFLDLANEMEQAAERIAALEAQLANVEKKMGDASIRSIRSLQRAEKAEQLVADRDRQIERLQSAITDAVSTLADMHGPIDECALHGGEGCLACLTQIDLANALATTTPPETRETV